METFDSSGDEQRNVDASNASHQQFADRSSSLLEIDHNIDVARAKEERAMFQEALSIAESSKNKSPDEKALLTAMTFALYDLDSHWTINSFDSTKKSIPMQRTLGARDRIDPWSLHIEKNSESRWNALLSHEGISPTAKRVPPKPSRDLKMSLQSNALSDDSYRSVEESYRSTISFDVSDRKGPPPKPPKELLTKASFNLKKSAVIEKICLDLLLDPPSEEEESDDDVAETIEHSLTTNKIKLQKWFMSILKLDPRWQIRKFFDDASVSFDNAEIFTVWRPTSFDAVAKIMRGEGVGKGLDIKGKSAVCGELSGVSSAHFVLVRCCLWTHVNFLDSFIFSVHRIRSISSNTRQRTQVLRSRLKVRSNSSFLYEPRSTKRGRKASWRESQRNVTTRYKGNVCFGQNGGKRSRRRIY
jgi:hypothetical protein